MRSLMILVFAVIMLLAWCSGCSSDDPTTNPPTPEPPMNESLEDYWATSDDMTTAMVGLSALMDEMDTAMANLGAGKSTNADMDVLVNQYYNQSLAAAAHFDELIALENSIHGYGSDKGMFTDLVTGVVRGVYNTGKNVVVSSGQMVRTSWRVLSGSHSLRQALRDPDSGIPIVSSMARNLQQHNAQRDEAILDSIMSGNTQEGSVPLGDMPGATAEDRANYYRNLPDEDPLKMRVRGDVHLWHDGERRAIAVTMKKAGQDGVKTYAGAVSGSDALVEVGTQLQTPGPAPTPVGTLAPLVKKSLDGALVNAAKTMIINKRNQPENEPKIVILEGVDPDFDVNIPTGEYDVIVIAEDYIRSAAIELEIAASQTAGILLEMYEFAGNSAILESVTASPQVAIVDEVVTVNAVAASIIGGTLSFDWVIAGGPYSDFSSSGPVCEFVPTEAGDYTITVTVTGSAGEPKTGSASVEVTLSDVQVESFDFTVEQFDDDAVNPGETLTISARVANGTDSVAVGNVNLVGTGLVSVVGGNYPGLSVPANGSVDITAQVLMPMNYSDRQGVVEFHFVDSEVEIIQDLLFDVEFYVELAAVSSPVTDRVLVLSGRVANPSLTSAHLVLDTDIDQVFQVNLVNGAFSQSVALEASSSVVAHHARLSADSGSWHAEDDLNFSAQIAPAGLRVTLGWDTNGTDVDLWVTGPDGEKCYYNNPSTASGLTLDFDDTDGYGPENITNGNPPAGSYLVQVHYFSDHDDEEAIGTSCTLVIRLNEGTPEEEVFNYYGSLGDTDDVWTVTTLTVGDKGMIQLDDDGRHSTVDSSTLPVK